MTTNFSWNSFLVASLALTALVALPVYAQNDPVNNSGVVLLGEATSTEPLATTSEEVVAVVQPWFRVEKLTGDNLAVGDLVVTDSCL
jgi:hypothetical protein